MFLFFGEFFFIYFIPPPFNPPSHILLADKYYNDTFGFVDHFSVVFGSIRKFFTHLLFDKEAISDG